MMWKCPRCGQKFVNRNQSHSCGDFTVNDFLHGRSDHAVKLFRAFLKKYKSVGKYELHPVKTRVALLTQMRFASINKLGDDFLDGHLVLTELHQDAKVFYKIDNLINTLFVHHFRIFNTSELDSRFVKYMKLAYRIGNREHIRRKPG